MATVTNWIIVKNGSSGSLTHKIYKAYGSASDIKELFKKIVKKDVSGKTFDTIRELFDEYVIYASFKTELGRLIELSAYREDFIETIEKYSE